MRVKVYMKSGNVVEFEAEKWKTERHRMSGELAGYSWEAKPHHRLRLHTLELSEVEAITTEVEEAEIPEEE